MTMHQPSLPWLAPGQAFPAVTQSWGADSPAPGLLCAGGDLTADTLQRAYTQGIFPWYSEGQPLLWWSPDPRMVLNVNDFCLHPSLKKTIRKFSNTPGAEIRFDSTFESVIHACSASPRGGQSGTWIVPEMIDAYINLHNAGFAHSVETWVNGQLLGGLYFVAVGKAVFGESMFHRATDASKIALAALVALCRHHHLTQIDCQQNTRHLASLGAHEIPRSTFVNAVRKLVMQPGPEWTFAPLYWRELNASKSVYA